MGINLNFNVFGNEIIRTDSNLVAGNSVDFVLCRFKFDETWNGLTKTAVFENMAGQSYDVVLDTDSEVDGYFASEALAVAGNGGGFAYVSVRGVAFSADGETIAQRGTANKIYIPLEANGAVEGAENAPVTSSDAEQVIAALAKSQWKTGTAITGTGTGISAEVENAVAGMHYINETTSNVYICTDVNGTTSTWNYVCSFKGVKGDTGNAGRDLIPVNNQSQFASWKLNIAPGNRSVCIVCDDFSEYVQGDVISCEKDGFGEVTLIKYSIIGADGQDGAPGAKGDKGDKGADGTPGAKGQDGYSPAVTISEITGGHSVTITDKTHQSGQSFNVLDGTDGTDGQDGVNGVSPTVTITEITTAGTHGHRVIITDADGTQSFDVIDGVNGTDGNNFLVYDDTNSLDTLYTFYGARTVTMLWLGENEAYEYYPFGDTDIKSTIDLVSYQVYYVSIGRKFSPTYGFVQTLSFTSVANIKGVKGDKGDTGNTGATGNGISSITKTSTSGKVDTYTITYTDNTTSTFTVTNGNDGASGQAGADGISVTGATIDSLGHLVISLSDSTTSDAGDIVQAVIDALPSAVGVSF